MDVFNPPKPPTVASSATFTANVLEANFGDGYEQTASAGLNSLTVVYQASWDILSAAEREVIEDFFSAHKGYIAFLYTFPGESTQRKFKCKTWTRGSNGALYTLRAELREVFDLA